MGTSYFQIMPRLEATLNAICPYFTMFPLEFPLRALTRAVGTEAAVLDPFCGRGTTNMAGRMLGLPSFGIDSHPLAVALTEAKLVDPSPRTIMLELDEILNGPSDVGQIPGGEFWDRAYDESTLVSICRVRSALLQDCESSARVALRAIMLGALHGPVTKQRSSYLSNQCPRTYAPKPRYSVSYWQKHDLYPPKVDIRELVARRAVRYYSASLPKVCSRVILGDCRDEEVFQREFGERQVDWVITSPPYYGMRTYRPDQWIRLWFLGGPDTVDYSQQDQLTHESPESFARQLSEVWRNCARVSKAGARMVIRFGQIPDRRADPVDLLRLSLSETGWRIQTLCDAGSASMGKRQANHFGVNSSAKREFDLWAVNAR